MDNNIKILRDLASRYFEYAMSDKNFEKMSLHKASNDMVKGTRPVVLMDEIPWDELEPAEELRVVNTDRVLAGVEGRLRRALFQLKYFPADMVVPPYMGVTRVVYDGNETVKPRYAEIEKTSSEVKAHQFTTQLRSAEDVENTFKFSSVVYDKNETMRRYELVADAIGDIVPVRLVGLYAVMGFNNTPWDTLAQYFKLDDLLMNLYDEPELMHACVGRLTDIFLDTVRQYEKLGVLEGESFSLHGTPALTNDLHPDFSDVKLNQVWGRAAAQIFAVASPDMHDEFDISYQMKAMEPFGLVYYGCCEPLHQKIDIVSKIPHLRKVGVTPWADADMAIDAMAGRYVVSAKANPGLVAEPRLNEDAITKELDKYIAACRRTAATCDITLKDISTVSHRTENLVEWERIAMRAVQK